MKLAELALGIRNLCVNGSDRYSHLDFVGVVRVYVQGASPKTRAHL
jgi:hypothetical protein